MKTIFALFLILFGWLANAQSIDYNTKNGVAVDGYDVVSYFDNNPQKGNSNFIATHDNVKYRFSSLENLNTFNENPAQFLPQYGGYCAYAIAVKGDKVSVNPKTFEIRDGKLYLFYNSWGMNTLKSWLNDSPDELKNKADSKWESIK